MGEDGLKTLSKSLKYATNLQTISLWGLFFSFSFSFLNDKNMNKLLLFFIQEIVLEVQNAADVFEAAFHFRWV